MSPPRDSVAAGQRQHPAPRQRLWSGGGREKSVRRSTTERPVKLRSGHPWPPENDDETSDDSLTLATRPGRPLTRTPMTRTPRAARDALLGTATASPFQESRHDPPSVQLR